MANAQPLSQLNAFQRFLQDPYEVLGPELKGTFAEKMDLLSQAFFSARGEVQKAAPGFFDRINKVLNLSPQQKTELYAFSLKALIGGACVSEAAEAVDRCVDQLVSEITQTSHHATKDSFEELQSTKMVLDTFPDQYQKNADLIKGLILLFFEAKKEERAQFSDHIKTLPHEKAVQDLAFATPVLEYAAASWRVKVLTCAHKLTAEEQALVFPFIKKINFGHLNFLEALEKIKTQYGAIFDHIRTAAPQLTGLTSGSLSAKAILSISIAPAREEASSSAAPTETEKRLPRSILKKSEVPKSKSKPPRNDLNIHFLKEFLKDPVRYFSDKSNFVQNLVSLTYSFIDNRSIQQVTPQFFESLLKLSLTTPNKKTLYSLLLKILLGGACDLDSDINNFVKGKIRSNEYESGEVFEQLRDAKEILVMFSEDYQKNPAVILELITLFDCTKPERNAISRKLKIVDDAERVQVLQLATLVIKDGDRGAWGDIAIWCYNLSSKEKALVLPIFQRITFYRQFFLRTLNDLKVIFSVQLAEIIPAATPFLQDVNMGDGCAAIVDVIREIHPKEREDVLNASMKDLELMKITDGKEIAKIISQNIGRPKAVKRGADDRESSPKKQRKDVR